MTIEHVALYVSGLEAARDFFVQYFDAAAGAEYRNERTGFRSYFLSFEGGARLEIMSSPHVSDGGAKSGRTGYAHIAFSLGSAEKVNRLTERLRADGYDAVSGPRTTGDGYYESCIIGIEGNLIELTV